MRNKLVRIGFYTVITSTIGALGGMMLTLISSYFPAEAAEVEEETTDDNKEEE